MTGAIGLIIWAAIVYKSVTFFMQDSESTRTLFKQSIVCLLWCVVIIGVVAYTGSAFKIDFDIQSMFFAAFGICAVIAGLFAKFTGLALLIIWLKSRQQKGLVFKL